MAMAAKTRVCFKVASPIVGCCKTKILAGLSVPCKSEAAV